VYCIDKAIDADSYNDEYFFQKGYIFHVWGDPELAIVAYAGALRLNPENEKARTNRDQILDYMKNPVVEP
jgi:hypothetical protein